MSCMCGDTYCTFCGPAQGNSKCPACGIWTADGGCEKPEECDKILRKMDEEEERAYLVDKMNEKLRIKQGVKHVHEIEIPRSESIRWRDMPIEELRVLQV